MLKSSYHSEAGMDTDPAGYGSNLWIRILLNTNTNECLGFRFYLDIDPVQLKVDIIKFNIDE